MDSTPQRTCKICGVSKPATAEFFHRHKGGKFGLRTDCKVCSYAAHLAFLAANPGYKDRLRAEHEAATSSGVARPKRTRMVRNPNTRTALQRRNDWRRDNPERERETQRRTRARHPETNRANVERYRCRLKAAPGNHTGDDIRNVMAEQGHRCAYCMQPLRPDFEVDHMTPLSRGGSNGPENIAAACISCNARKRDMTAEEFLVRLFFRAGRRAG